MSLIGFDKMFATLLKRYFGARTKLIDSYNFEDQNAMTSLDVRVKLFHNDAYPLNPYDYRLSN
jgi:hypothetical protein